MKVFRIILILFFAALCLTCYGQRRTEDSIYVVHFASNSYLLSGQEKQKLDIFFSADNDMQVLAVAGFADTVGNEKKNLQLSLNRIRTVEAWLKSHAIFKNAWDTENFGETRSNNNINNAGNRKVEIRIKKFTPKKLPKIEEGKAIVKKYSFDKLYFQPDKPVLETFSLGYVDVIARILKTYKKCRFDIRGHVNCALNVDEHSGYMQKMNKLSFDRAKAIYEMLIDRGIPPGKMTWLGMGNKEMIIPDASTDEEKRKNMRVEVIVVRDSL